MAFFSFVQRCHGVGRKALVDKGISSTLRCTAEPGTTGVPRLVTSDHEQSRPFTHELYKYFPCVHDVKKIGQLWPRLQPQPLSVSGSFLLASKQAQVSPVCTTCKAACLPHPTPPPAHRPLLREAAPGCSPGKDPGGPRPSNGDSLGEPRNHPRPESCHHSSTWGASGASLHMTSLTIQFFNSPH